MSKKDSVQNGISNVGKPLILDCQVTRNFSYLKIGNFNGESQKKLIHSKLNKGLKIPQLYILPTDKNYG